MHESLDSMAKSFASSFWGYGNPSSPLWFVGMEEAGVSSRQQFETRLGAWGGLGKPSFADVAKFHREIGEHELFDAPVVHVQATWRKLIRCFLKSRGIEPNAGRIKEAQKCEWGRSDSDNCLMELFPLPAASVRDWPYADILSGEEFESRSQYLEHFGERRTKAMADLIECYQPTAVVFYSSQARYLGFWGAVVGGDASWQFDGVDGVDRFRYQITGDRIYIVVPHPTAFGVTNAVFDRIGEVVGRRLHKA
jgi:hypothetical protein